MLRKNTLISLLKRELLSFYLLPSTYFAGAFFLISTAAFFFYINRFFVTNVGSTDLRYYFYFFPISFILFIPTLTMSLWLKDDLETVLPVSSFQIIFSKWLATLIVVMAYVLVSLALILVVYQFGTVELSVVLSSCIGIFLLSASLCSIGQFCSIILKGQAASFFVSALSFSLFTINGYVLQGSYLQSSMLTNIIRFFSFSNNFDSFSKGIIDTRNILFFILTTILFLVISSSFVELRKFSAASVSLQKKQSKKILFLLLAFLCLCLLNSQIFYKRFDISENNKFTLSQYTKNVVDSLNSNVSITYYVSPELNNAFPQSRDIEDFLYEYSTYSEKVKVKVVHPASEDIFRSLQTLGIVKLDIPSIEANRTSILQVYSAIVLEYQNKTEVIPFLVDTTSLEYDLVGRIQSLNSTLFRTAFILVGNGLSLSGDYPFVTPFLESSGFAVRELDSNDILQVANLDIATPLVILGSAALTVEHIQSIQTFLEIGGKVFFSVSPIDINLDTWASTYNIESIHPMFNLLKNYGITISPALIHDNKNLQTRLLSQTGDTVELEYPFFIEVTKSQINNAELLGDSLRGLSLLWPSPIDVDDASLNTKKISRSSDSSWLQEANRVLYEQTGEAFTTNPFFEQNMNSDDAKVGEHTVVATYSDSVVVVSDQYFLSRATSYIDQKYIFNNFDFLVNSLLWLQNNHDLIHIKSKTFTDYTLYKISNSTVFMNTLRNCLIFLSLWYILAIISPYIYINVKRSRDSKEYNKRKQ